MEKAFASEGGMISSLSLFEIRTRVTCVGREQRCMLFFGRGDDRVGNPHRAQVYQFELFKLILLLKLDKQFTVEQFEATIS